MNLLKFTFGLFIFMLSIKSNAQLNFYKNSNISVLNIVGDTLKSPWVGGFNSMQFSEIDLNMDGIQDLFAFDKTGNKIYTFINSGTPGQVSYTYDPSFASLFPKLKNWVLLRDYNCDGKMDIFSSTTAGIIIYKNISSSSFLNFSLATNLLYSKFYTSYVNLYVSPNDVPAIDDIDNDGDLDILTLGVIGARIEYHKNLSMEKYGTCDSLDFELRNTCWGYIAEDHSYKGVSILDTCDENGNVPNPERIKPQQSEATVTIINGGNKHTGTSLLTLDVDSNNSSDLVMGSILHESLVLLKNNDLSANLDSSSMISQDTLFPKNQLNSTAMNLKNFPAGYYLDINNDNIKDLLVSSNCRDGCENTKSVWYYKNSNTNNKPVFTLQTKAFLQENMIEIGEGTHPVFFDYNEDGLMDIVVGNYGYYDSTALGAQSSLALFENIGSASLPSFQLITTDYMGISTINLNTALAQPTLGLHPTFGDLDDDGDNDMILGDYLGKLHYFENTAGAGNTANFILNQADYQSIDVGNNAAPQLVDLNNDLILDLVIGKLNGYVSYYGNHGTAASPSFALSTDSLGKVNTKELGYSTGYSVPHIVNDSGSYKMICGSQHGRIYEYGNIDGNLSGTFSLLDTAFLDIWEGVKSSVHTADINNDGKLDLLIGNYSGGISFYQGGLNTSIKDYEKLNNQLSIYPNPAKNSFTLAFDNPSLKNLSYELILYNLLGSVITTKIVGKDHFNVNTSNISDGIYLIRLTSKEQAITFTKKLVLAR